MTGIAGESYSSNPIFTYGPMDIKAFNAAGAVVWSATIDFAYSLPDSPDVIQYSDWGNWLTVDVNTADISKLVFYGSDNYGGVFFPSIDNMVINESAAVPIPGAVWLLGSGLLGLAGLRRQVSG